MEVFHELGCELRPTITNHLSRDSELLPHVVTEELGGSHRRDFSGCWDSYDVLGELINDYHYCIVSLQYWQSSDGVDSDMFPKVVQGWHLVVEGRGFPLFSFSLVDRVNTLPRIIGRWTECMATSSSW